MKFVEIDALEIFRYGWFGENQTFNPNPNIYFEEFLKYVHMVTTILHKRTNITPRKLRAKIFCGHFFSIQCNDGAHLY